MKIKKLFLIVLLVIAISAIIGCSASSNSVISSPNYDLFAKCLSEKGVKMYGAYWCPHCSNQKEMFGESFQYINYIECSLPNKAGQTKICIDAGIKGYPTWDFQNGERIEGALSLGQLSQDSGCSLGG